MSSCSAKRWKLSSLVFVWHRHVKRRKSGISFLESRGTYRKDLQQQKDISIVHLEASAPTKCHGRAINHISKIIPAARGQRSGRKDRVSRAPRNSRVIGSHYTSAGCLTEPNSFSSTTFFSVNTFRSYGAGGKKNSIQTLSLKLTDHRLAVVNFIPFKR